jgi:hypothetical protein
LEREVFVEASLKGFESILNGEDVLPATRDDKGVKLTTLTAEQKAIVDINKKGLGELILSINCNTPTGRVAFSMVKNTKTT